MDLIDTQDLKPMIEMANQVFELERKIANIPEAQRLQRNVRRMRQALEDNGILIYDPHGEEWSETRTDCEASISGDSPENLRIIEVIKPILRFEEKGLQQIIQRGVVVVGNT